MSQTAAERREYKTNWQREKRGRLARENGFSTTADYLARGKNASPC